VTTKGQGKGA